MQITRKEWFYIPNIITYSRILLFPLPPILIAYGEDGWAIFWIIYGMVSDVLDGILARKLNQMSDLGKVLDPLADKLAVGSLAIALYYYKDFPFWAMAIIVGRDLLILILSLLMMRKTTRPPSSTLFGKLTALTWSLLLFSYLTSIVLAQQILLYLAVIMLPISFAIYLIKGYRKKRKVNTQNHT